jgi:hypothetical protein
MLGVEKAGARGCAGSVVPRACRPQSGYNEDQNVAVEYYRLDGCYDLVPGLIEDLTRRGVAVIATPGSNVAALAAKAATTTVPIVFGVGQDPVKLDPVASLARPGGNATGINMFGQETVTSGSRSCISSSRCIPVGGHSCDGGTSSR